MQKTFCIAIFFTVVLIACATVVAPSGGPEDKLPPRVSGVYPAPNATNMPEELYVKILFDEWINENISRSAITISPPLEKKLRTEVHGDVLEITSRALLDSNTTYTLTIGSGIKDLHGNALSMPFQLSFSTGKHIDSLFLLGRVLITPEMFKAKQYPSIALYPIGTERMHRNYLKKYRDSSVVDTFPRFTKEVPQFVTQADSNGFFKLIGLHAGHYAVLSFLDKNGNRRLEPSDEDAGVFGDIYLDSLWKDSLWIPLASMDTSLVKLDSVKQMGAHMVQAYFNRNVLLDSLDKCFMYAGRDTLFPEYVFSYAKSKLPTFYFVTSLKEDSLYTFKCDFALDSSGITLDTVRNSYEFTWTDASFDTLKPSLAFTTPFNGEKDVFLHSEIKLVFDKPVFGDSIGDYLRFTFLKDTVKVFANRQDAVSFIVRPEKNLPLDASVSLLERYMDTTLALPDSVGFRDTLITPKFKKLIAFETVKKLRMASLKGTIPGGDALTYVKLRSVETGAVFDTLCTPSGSFSFESLLDGKYIVEYFRGLSNGRLDVGTLEPFKKAKPWRSPVDTLILLNGENVLENLIQLPALPQE